MTRTEEIRLCGKTKKEVKATNHCRAFFEDTNTQGILICEIDNIMTNGIPFTDDYVELLAEKICKIINEDLKDGVTGQYWEDWGKDKMTNIHSKCENYNGKKDYCLKFFEENVSERYKTCKEYSEFDDKELSRKWSN